MRTRAWLVAHRRRPVHAGAWPHAPALLGLPCRVAGAPAALLHGGGRWRLWCWFPTLPGLRLDPANSRASEECTSAAALRVLAAAVQPRHVPLTLNSTLTRASPAGALLRPRLSQLVASLAGQPVAAPWLNSALSRPRRPRSHAYALASCLLPASRLSRTLPSRLLASALTSLPARAPPTFSATLFL